MLHIQNITFRIAGRTLLDKASVTIPSGARIGLFGRNGTGKTSLFKLITEEWSLESGSITIAKNTRIGKVAQEAPSGNQSLLSFVLASDQERTNLLNEAKTASDPNRIADIQTRLTDIDAHSAEARASRILAGLGFNSSAQQLPCSDFSGGWRMRVALASILFCEPDLLLLDEPTNYLDLEGTLWLESYLARYPYTVIIISHDRDLLNNAVNHIVHLNDCKLSIYRGGYDGFERTRREQLIRQSKLQVKQEAARKHMEDFINRFRSKATKARQAQSRLKALARMEPIASIIDNTIQPIHFPNSSKPLSPPIIHLENVAVGYEAGKPILSALNLRIDPDDRIALLGANGQGKSTFAKLLSKRLQALSGEITWATKIKIAYFAQHQLDELNPNQSALDHIRAKMPQAAEASIRARTAQIGLDSAKMKTPVSDLSGGEKARLLLGIATLQGPDLLILDEPTNHLDIDSRQALVQALTDYQGAVILISHDRHLLEASADRLWLIDKGTVHIYDGDLNDYRKYVLQPEKNRTLSSHQNEKTHEKRQVVEKPRNHLVSLRKKIAEAEKRIERIKQELEKIDVALIHPNIHKEDPQKGTALAKRRTEAVTALQQWEDHWLQLSSEYEGMTENK